MSKDEKEGGNAPIEHLPSCVCTCVCLRTLCSSTLQVTEALEQLLALAEEKLDESASIVQIIVSRYCTPSTFTVLYKENDVTIFLFMSCARYEYCTW